jgi:hypothetical protein
MLTSSCVQGTLMVCAGFLPVINKGNGHETFNDCIGGSACALKYLCAGSSRRRYGRRNFRRRQFRRTEHRFIRDWNFNEQPAGLDGRSHQWRRWRLQHHHESIGKYVSAERFAQRIDVNADRTGFGPQQISDASAMNEKPRLAAGLFAWRVSC